MWQSIVTNVYRYIIDLFISTLVFLIFRFVIFINDIHYYCHYLVFLLIIIILNINNYLELNKPHPLKIIYCKIWEISIPTLP